MKKLILFALFLGNSLFAQDQSTLLNVHLSPFESFIGNSYRGFFSSSTPDNPMIDIQYWAITNVYTNYDDEKNFV